MTDSPQPVHPLFRLAGLSAAVFIVTVFALVATVFGDQQSPVARFLNDHGGMLIAVEVVLTLLLTFFAMAADARRTRRELEEKAFGNPATAKETSPDENPS